jgi:hypothetical protein
MSWTTQTKTAATFTNKDKSTTIFESGIKEGKKWFYNQAGIQYNTDEVDNTPVLYNRIGRAMLWTNKLK